MLLVSLVMVTVQTSVLPLLFFQGHMQRSHLLQISLVALSPWLPSNRQLSEFARWHASTGTERQAGFWGASRVYFIKNVPFPVW